MAYLRKEDEIVEISYSLSKVWTTILKVFATLEWNIEQLDETAHHIKARTKAGPMSWSSMLLVDVTSVDENTARVAVASETPVTTIMAIIDFRQGKRRIFQFLGELAKQLAD